MDYWTIILSFLVICCTLYYWLTRNNYFEDNGIIHMKPLPFFGNSAPLFFQRMSFVDYTQRFYDLDREAKYVGIYDMNVPTISIHDPELFKLIAVKYFDHFVDHRDFVDTDMEPLFKNNLFTLHGDKWRKMRHLLSPAFTSSKMKAMFKLMSDCAESFTDYLVNEAKAQPYTINSKDAFSRYGNDVIATCAFGVAVDSMRNPNNKFYALGKKAASIFQGLATLKFFMILRFPRLARLLNVKLIDRDVDEFFNGLVKDTVETRDREGIVRPDMLQLMMESRNNTSGEGKNLTIEDMVSQAFAFFFAGFDSTSAQLCLIAHVIATHLDVQKKLQDEIDEVYERCNGDVTYEQINSMQYLDAVINETIRLYPAGIILDRRCTKSFELPPALPGKKSFFLKPGDSIVFPLYPIQRDPKYFPNPEEFNPERFIEDPAGTLHSSAFVPFGCGPRICIGSRFAILEMKVLIFQLVAKCSLVPGKEMILPLKFSTSDFNLMAKGGFFVTLKPRNKWEKKEQN